MTNKQLYNLVFENFVQAKRELIKEGYRKESFENVDFNEVFNKTKSVMQEEKIKSLQRENEMLRKKLQKENVMRAAALGKQTDALGSETIWDFLTKVSAMAGSKTAKADIIANELEKNKEFTYKEDKEKFKYKYINFRKSGLNSVDATQKALDELKKQNTLTESKKRRRY